MFKNKESFMLHFQRRLLEKFGRKVEDSSPYERYDILGTMVADQQTITWRGAHEAVARKNQKQLIYFSMEFLMGRLLVNNMMNIGVYKVAKYGLAELGIDIHELEEIETDAGLGNGGLGRLAACFLDSIASLGYPGHGNSIRYEYGFFKQKFVHGKQIEVPDQWLINGNVWETKKPQEAQIITFGGEVVSEYDEKGIEHFKTINGVQITAMPYIMNIPGYLNNVENILRLWSAEPVKDFIPSEALPFEKYLGDLKQITHSLYPDDSTEEGRMLRVKQQYFFSSAGIQFLIHRHMRKNKTVKGLSKTLVFQLNDTHPILAIPETMRLMMDEYNLTFEEAWDEVTKLFAYTNHTTLPEALEKWPVDYIKKLIPRCYQIIQMINAKFERELIGRGVEESERDKMRIIHHGHVRMANLGIYASFSVNGVAKIHSDILKETTFRSFYAIYPEKFNNKTNGVTHRRWLMYANLPLTKLLDKRIGQDWKKNADKLKNLMPYVEDEKTQKEFLRVKHIAKVVLKEHIKKMMNIEIDERSIFDVQIKRLHAYKRQSMNILHIIYLYQRLKADKNFKIHPRTFIFGAKAAPSYVFAKRIIELIIAVAKVINNDPDTNKMLKLVFIENYGVSWAEKIIPAADISEQISTAGKEASGTSNMKFMMNGAVTLGTLDGANVEIHQLVGDDNSIIFGLNEDEVKELHQRGDYQPRGIYESDPRLNAVLNSLLDDTWSPKEPGRFRLIFDELIYRGDEYLVLRDFDSYVKAHEKSDELYRDKENWAKMCLVNIAQSGYFSSDRTINQYVKEIWKIKKINL